MRSIIALAASLALTAIFSSPTVAQQATPADNSGSSRKVLGSVVKGNTTLIFEAAKLDNRTGNLHRTWDDFAAGHASIARDLGNKPELINDQNYLKAHGELRRFFADHPDIQQAMTEDPGNFVLSRAVMNRYRGE